MNSFLWFPWIRPSRMTSSGGTRSLHLTIFYRLIDSRDWLWMWHPLCGNIPPWERAAHRSEEISARDAKICGVKHFSFRIRVPNSAEPPPSPIDPNLSGRRERSVSGNIFWGYNLHPRTGGGRLSLKRVGFFFCDTFHSGHHSKNFKARHFKMY